MGESTSAAILLLSPNGAPDASTCTSPLFIFRSASVEWWCWSSLRDTWGAAYYELLIVLWHGVGQCQEVFSCDAT